MNAATPDQSKATLRTQGRNHRDARVLILVREHDRVRGEVVTMITHPQSGTEKMILAGPYFENAAESADGSEVWHGRYLECLSDEIAYQARRSGFSECVLAIDLGHCHAAKLISVRDMPARG